MVRFHPPLPPSSWTTTTTQPAHPILKAFRDAVARYDLFRPADRVIVAVSGGADSVALLRLALAEADRWRLTLAVGHLDHRLRAGASGDRRFVEELAREAGLPVFAAEQDVRALARAEKRSLEDAGRAARNRFFARVAGEWGATSVALGHQRDDQAEGFLMRALQGSGSSGLAAIRPVVHSREGVRLVRPLLAVPRALILDYLRSLEAPFRTDETNADPSFLRNRVRMRLLPLIEREFNPKIREALARSADILRDEDELLATLATGWLDRLAATPERIPSIGSSGAVPGRVPPAFSAPELPVGEMRSLPRALARRIVRQSLLRAGSEPRSVRFDQVERILDLLASSVAPGPARGGPSRRISLAGGMAARIEGGRLSFGPGGHAERAPAPVFLAIPGETRLPGRGEAVPQQCLRAVVLAREALAEPLASGRGPVAHLDFDSCGERLAVRTPRSGDRFHPLGAPGRRKLSDVFVDAGVPRTRRESIPLVIALPSPPLPGADDSAPPRLGIGAAGEIAWVAGVRISERFRVGASTRRILRLEIHDGRETPA